MQLNKNTNLIQRDAQILALFGFNTELDCVIFIDPSPVGWDCRIHWLHLYTGVRLSNECPRYDTKNDGKTPVMLEIWGMWITPSLTLLPDPLWPGMVAPDNESNRTVLHLNCMQTNDLSSIELLENELFDYLTVCKQMSNV